MAVRREPTLQQLPTPRRRALERDPLSLALTNPQAGGLRQTGVWAPSTQRTYGAAWNNLSSDAMSRASPRCRYLPAPWPGSSRS